MSVHRTPPHLATLIALTALSLASLNMFLPSLANIATDFDADYGTVSLAIGGYLAVTAVVALVVGPLSDRFGRRPVLLGALAFFALASVGCALAESIEVFLIFRMLQAGMAAGNSLSLAIVRDTREGGEAASLIGYISMVMALAPMLGPMLGGGLDAVFGWRATFWVYSAAGALLLFVCWRDLGETRARSAPGTKRNAFDLVSERRFWAYALCSMFSLGGFFIFLTGAPLVAQSTFGVGAAELGLYIGSITAGFMFGSFLSGRLGTRVAGTSLMLSGRVVAVVGLTTGLLAVLLGYVTPLAFFGSTIFFGIGNGLTMPSSNTGAMSVSPGLVGTAAGWNAALGVGGGAVMTTITGIVIPEEGGAPVLLGLMIFASVAGLLCALWALALERRAALEVLTPADEPSAL